MRRKFRAAAVPALLTIELVVVAALALQTLPVRPMTFQRDAFYSAFLIGDEASLEAVAIIRWVGAALVACLMAPLVMALVQVGRRRTIGARGPVRPATAGSDGPERFDLHLRTQHILLFSSVAVLALTGLPQAFPEWPGSSAVLGWFGGVMGARTAHRTAATVLDFAVLYHLGYLLARALLVTRAWPAAMLPDMARMRHARQGPRPRHADGPAARQFTAGQQLDYWVAAAGAPTMTLSGLVLVHADLAQQWLPAAAVGISVALHRSVALLFVAYVVVVHMYRVHWSPEVFPFNPAMFTGHLRGDAPSSGAVPDTPALRLRRAPGPPGGQA